MAYYTQRNKKAHRYWNKILTRMDQYQKMRAMVIWRENAGLHYENELTNLQDLTTDAIFKRNQILNAMESTTQD